MRKESEQSPNNSIKTLLLFCIGVGCIIVISLLVRFFTLFQEGRLHGDHTYIVLQNNSNESEIIAFKPEEKKVIHITSTQKMSMDELKRRIGVFLDGELRNLDISYSINKNLAHLLLHKGEVSSNLAYYDVIMLWRISRGIEKESEEEVIIDTRKSEEEIDREVRELLLDKTLSDENKTISIINSSGVPGLGRRLERALENVGGNVISVENGESILKESSIMYYGEKNNTVKRLEAILYATAQEQERQELSDIIIKIGTDKKESQNF